MNWTMDDLFEFKNKVLNYKEDHMGERIGNYTFGGAGQKSIKLNGSVPEDYIFISYEDVLNEETNVAKDVFDYFFNNDNSSSENITVENIPEINGDYEDAIENILMERGIMSEDDLLYPLSDIKSKPWKDKENKINYITKSFDLVLFDTKYLYLIRKAQIDNDYEVERIRYDSTFKALL